MSTQPDRLFRVFDSAKEALENNPKPDDKRVRLYKVSDPDRGARYVWEREHHRAMGHVLASWGVTCEIFRPPLSVAELKETLATVAAVSPQQLGEAIVAVSDPEVKSLLLAILQAGDQKAGESPPPKERGRRKK
jgi:hypothetical protein